MGGGERESRQRRRASELTSNDQWYGQVKRKGVGVNAYAWVGLTMILLSQLGHWRGVAIVVIYSVILAPSNILFDLHVGRRLGERAEIYRSVMNSVVGITAFVLIGWPLPVWFWLPYTAATMDTPTPRRGLAALLVLSGSQAAVAIACGVPLHIPLFFLVLTLIVWVVTLNRSLIIRDMARAAEEQRAELEVAHEGLKQEIIARERAELELRQAQKLEAIGRLAAGVAHEINTPMQFVSDSLEFVSDGANDLIQLAQRCATPEQAEHADLAYLSTNMPTALAHAYDGVKRVASIIRSMKEFAHPGVTELAPVDLNSAIHNTLVISTYEHKLVADVVTDFGDIPTVEANASELNQVLLNVIVNAAHAIADHAVAGVRGTIAISSRRDGEAVVVRVRDTGGGIPEAIRTKIFDPFFTTKQVGRGTGQGLAISRSVLERAGGTLTFETEVGVGTTFVIRVPVAAPAREIDKAA